MTESASLVFQDIFDAVMKRWPAGFSDTGQHQGGGIWHRFEDLGVVEDTVSESFIDDRDELMFRELSWSISICVDDLARRLTVLPMSSIRAEYVREKFESRISVWKEADDGYTADMAARSRYYAENGLV